MFCSRRYNCMVEQLVTSTWLGFIWVKYDHADVGSLLHIPRSVRVDLCRVVVQFLGRVIPYDGWVLDVSAAGLVTLCFLGGIGQNGLL